MILINLIPSQFFASSWAILNASLLVSIAQPIAFMQPFITSQSQSFAQFENENSIFFRPPTPPPGQGGPPETRGAGSRGPCPEIEPALTALAPLPPAESEVGSAWGLTTQERPTVLIYVPYAPDFIRSGEVSIREGETGSSIAEASLDLTSTPGIIQVSLPATVSLEVNQWYEIHVFVDVYCSENTPVQKDAAQIWVMRREMNPTVRTAIEQANTPLQEAIAYADHGFWFDALTATAELRRNDSSDRNWETLLRSVGLDAIATQPLVN